MYIYIHIYLYIYINIYIWIKYIYIWIKKHKIYQNWYIYIYKTLYDSYKCQIIFEIPITNAYKTESVSSQILGNFP